MYSSFKWIKFEGYIHTHINTHMHIYTYIYIHTYVVVRHARRRTCQACKETYVGGFIRYIYINTHTHTHTYVVVRYARRRT